MRGSLGAACALLAGSLAAQGVWETRAVYPLQATEVSAAAIGGKVYALCAFGGGNAAGSLHVYDPYIDTWARAAPLPVPGGIDHCNLAASGGKLYLLGWLGSRSETGDTYEYDPASDRWQVVGRMPTPRGASGVAAIGSRIYVAGGLAGGRSVATFEVFDTATRQWTPLPDMPSARDHLTAQAAAGKFYAIAGRVADVLTANEEYNPAANTWVRRAPIPTPRGGLGSGTLGGRIQVFGGEGPSGTPEGTYRQNEEYDPATDTWRSLPPMPTPRHGLYGATLAGCIFTPSGGPIAGANYSDVHEAFCLPPDPPIGIAGVRNAASGSPRLAPGTLVSLFGSRLAPLRQAAFRFPLPTQMSTTRVRINGTPAPLLYVDPGQINFFLPHDLAPGAATLTVIHAGLESAPLTLSLETSAPGIFALPGEQQGAILIAGTALLAGQLAGVNARPARRGEIVEIYATGLGRVLPGQRGAENPAPPFPLSRTVATPLLTIGGMPAEVLFSGLAPGFVGVYQVNARIPAAAPPGPAVPVVLRFAETEPPSNTVTIGIAESVVP